jgi:aminoglycoside phosphotransferase (APT) family kinase protein
MLRAAAPPADTVAWVCELLDATGVVDVAELPGGSAAAMHRLRVSLRSGGDAEVALRRYVLTEPANAPAVARWEANALGLAARVSVPTPELLGVDVDGERTDVPALVMSILPGRPVWETRRGREWVSQVVDAMLALHEIDPGGVELAPFRTYAQNRWWKPPRWTDRPGLWEQAMELFEGPVPTSMSGFIHRDFNPGNVLWVRDRVSGLVDWQTACVGPRSIDPAHCRLNLFQYQPRLADELLTVWEERSGLTFDRWADLVSILGDLDQIGRRRQANETTFWLERAVEQAVAELT